MIFSVCLAAFLPILALTWPHPPPYPCEGITFGLSPVPSKAMVPPHPSPPPRFSSMQSMAVLPPHPPLIQDHSIPTGRMATPKLWMMEKKKRTIQTVSAYEAPSQASTESPWINPNHQEQRLVGLRQDYFLTEQVNVPSGTRLIWYKNNVRVQREGDSAADVETVSPSSSVVTILSGVYLDCCDVDDGGSYRLEIRKPNSDEIVHRNYTILILDNNSLVGATCAHSINVINHLPRIYEYALSAVVPEGQSVVLPCGFQGLLTAFAWYLNNDLISLQDSNHEMRANGDVLIHHLDGGAAGSARYSCRVASTTYNINPDIASTSVSGQE